MMQKSRPKFLPSLPRIPRSSNLISSPSNLNINSSLKSVLLQTIKQIPIGSPPIEQLQLKWKNDEDLQQLKYILHDVLEYPSTDLAQLHRDCNRLGAFDILENHQLIQRMLYDQSQPEIYCQCCGFLLQRTSIPLCTPFSNISNIGISTILYFQTFLNLSLLLISLFLIYGIFSLVTNILAYDTLPSPQILPNPSYLILSLSPKQLSPSKQNYQYYFIQCWLGLGVVVIWFFVFLGVKYREQREEITVNSNTISAADFSVVVEGVPTGMSSQLMQEQLNSYYEQLGDMRERDGIKEIDRKFKIQRYNQAIPFYLTMDEFMDGELKELVNKKEKQKQIFVDWIKERMNGGDFPCEKTERIQAYNNYRRLENQVEKKYRKLVDQIVQNMKKEEHTNPTTSVYITFSSNYAKQLLLYLNYPEDTLIRTQKRLWCCQSDQYFTISFQGQKFLTNIKKAPEPQDIIWTNIGQSTKQSLLRHLLTYSITLLLLSLSFTIFYLLSKYQSQNSNDILLSFIISLSITIFNLLLQSIIRLLTNLQRSQTQSQYQSSLALKSILAQLINSIVLTFVVKHDIDGNIYYVDGLAYVVFTMGITNAFIAPLLKIADIGYLVWKVKCWVIGGARWRLGMGQSEVNLGFELREFQPGYQYIYPVNLFLFCCFFVSLQPIIAVFGVLGLLLMYWVQKYMLFNRCKRPFPGNNIINRAIYRLIYFGPLLFSLGNLTWSNLLPNGGPEKAIIPNLIAVGLSSVFVLIPNKMFFQKLLKKVYQQQMVYTQNRIYLSSQYDRLNPATAKKAMTEYYQYLKQYKKKIKDNQKQQIVAIQEMILNQKQRGSAPISPFLNLLCSINLESLEKEKERQKKNIQENLKLEEKEQQSDEDISAEENHIAIRESGVKEFTVKKQSKNKKFVTSDDLFKEIFFSQNNVIKFTQNWAEDIGKNIINANLNGQINQNNEGNSFLGLLLNNTIPKQQQNKINNEIKKDRSQNNLLLNIKQPQTDNNIATKKKPKLRMQKFEQNVQKKQVTYKILQQLLRNHENQKQKQIKSEDKLKDSNDSNEQSGPKLNENPLQNRNGILGLFLNSGRIIPRNDNPNNE